MSLANLKRASCRRYVESTALLDRCRIFAEEEKDYATWSKHATELMTLWVTETDRTGASHLDKYRPELDSEPTYKIEFKDQYTARIWVNICCLNQTEYETALRQGRDEAWTTMNSRQRWQDYTPSTKSEMWGRFEEVTPKWLNDTLDSINR